MNLTHTVVGLLRVLLIMLFVASLVGQLLSVPGQFSDIGQEAPALAGLRWPLTVWGVLELLCVQVVIVCTWKLLSLVLADRIFTEAALRWVDGIVWAVGAAWAVLVGVLLFVGFNASDPGLPLLLFLLSVGVTVLGLLMVVMRALLRRASTLRADMEAVI